MPLLVSNVVWPDDADHDEVVAAKLQVDRARIASVRLVKKSLDARPRTPRWVAVLRVEVTDEAEVLDRGVPGVREWTHRDQGRYGLQADTPTSRPRPHLRPIVVGAGPAGLFAALYLAEAGAKVTLLERGGPVAQRITAVNAHWRGRAPLDPESNLVFGEGGAGTFSDGKIYTRRRDGELGYIFRNLVAFGADEDVIQDAYAHLGTDRIRALLVPFRERLQALDVDVRYHCRVDEIVVEDGVCRGVSLQDGTVVEGGPVLVATGHSARDAVEMLLRAGAAAEPRGIAVGARVEHPQTLIDQARYGAARGELPPASYRLASNPVGLPAARTFCMCPGGMVVPAANQPEHVVVNGMSFAARRAYWANSAVIVEVPVSAYGSSDPMSGFRWQDAIERKAWDVGGGLAPAQRVQDLLAGSASIEVPRSSYPLGVAAADLRDVLPELVVGAMIDALRAFEAKIPGFTGPDGVLIAPETRTTSPIRFARDDHQQSSTVRGLYPVGEGAGFAGGIISSALDGLRAARAIVADPIGS